MHPTLKKLIRISLRSITVLILAGAALAYAIMQPGGSGVLATLRLPDGSEYMVTQHCNWSLEPYSVAFYMRGTDGAWGWCYINHQASRWHHAAMNYDAASDTITVTERGTWQAALDRKRRMFAIGDGQPKRELPAPQEACAPPVFASR